MSFPVCDVDGAVVAHLAAALGVRSVTARCLAARGVVEADQARRFLEPKLGGLRRPEGLAGPGVFDKAVERLAVAAMRGERVGVFGDYDVDGVTTAALLTSFLRAAGATVIAEVARRDAGYGFTLEAATAFADAGCTLVVTGDCGTSDLPSVASLAARRIDVVIVDHHTVPTALGTHPAYALVNPFRADSTFPFRGMASVGLGFYLVAAVKTRLKDGGHWQTRPEPDVRDLLDLVALGTIADLVPLHGENRILTAIGLRQLEARRRPGLAALLAAAGVEPGKPIDERTVAWKLAPRLNAPGRLGAALPSLDLLLAADAAAPAGAAVLEEANAARRVIQDRVFEEALAQLEREPAGPAVVLASRGWPAGVVGIVAAKLVERTGRPAFVIGVDDDGVGRGSARAGNGAGGTGIDLYRALAACASHLERFGGHAGAAGLTVREDAVPALREALGLAVAKLAEGSGPTTAAPCDAAVDLSDVDERLATELASLAPFGKGNDAPRLTIRNATVRLSRRVGDGSHLKLELQDATGTTRGAIGFGLGEVDPGAGARVDVAFAPVINEWRGERRVELELTAVHLATSPDLR